VIALPTFRIVIPHLDSAWSLVFEENPLEQTGVYDILLFDLERPH
jgi:hypothetical protein